MMLLRLLEKWTVSAGILLAVWYILLSNTTGGVYLSSRLLYEPCIRKSAFHICENNGADQVSSNRAADQRFCFPLHRLCNPSTFYIRNFKPLEPGTPAAVEI